ncbi:hypothetical protein [Arundinibacter roseus]|uniref:Uncharacterized protein n=1 Tax=Arundinibacter roseus TaxID=2070510 RepID=A0A4R4KGB9_9BACT|nr:hypothetical protein [Arundinibacter roseus]TDB65906.1 hypothetical protein EZE20_09060 [Arundinibacter roseus]
MKEFFRDVYEGIYFRDSDRQKANQRFFLTFYMYHLSLIMLLTGIRVVIYGPFKPYIPGILLLLFGVYGLIYWYFIRPHRNLGEIDENMDEALMEKKKRRSIYAQAGGVLCFVIVFGIVYVLYEIFDPKSMIR